MRTSTVKPKVIEHDASETPRKLRQPAKVRHTSRNRWVIMSSFLMLGLMSFFQLAPVLTDWFKREGAIMEFHAAIPLGYHAAMAEDARAADEARMMEEYLCLANTIEGEAERGNEADSLAIADVVFSRIASKLYPDTICDVTREVRQNRYGQDVAMFSFITSFFTRPAPSGDSWKFSRRMAAIALKQHLDGQKPSGNLNYHAPYVKPLWSVKDVAECKLKRVAVPGAFHYFYAPVNGGAEKAECYAQAEAKATAVSYQTLPKLGPKPLKRPEYAGNLVTNTVAKQDDLKSLILAAN